MRALRRLAALAALALLAVAGAPGLALAGPPLVPIQGNLTDPTGAPIEGTVQVDFLLYNAASGGTPVWSERQSIPVTDGFFVAYLGEVAELDLALFRDEPALYLGIAIEGDPEMERVQIATVPYAAFAEYCANVPESFDDLTGEVPTASLPAGTVIGAQSCPSGETVVGIDGAGTLMCGPGGQTYTGADFAVSGQSCSVGDVVTGIGADGAVTCAPPVSGGTGITVSGGAVSLAASYADGSAHDSRFVNGAGDTMSGALTVQGDVTADQYRYRTPRTGAVSVAALAFNTLSDQEDDIVLRSSLGYIWPGPAPDSAWSVPVAAPITLPDGVTVTGLTCHFYDSNATEDFVSTVSLYRAALTSTSRSTMGSVTMRSTGSSTTAQSVTDSTILSATVDNAAARYFLYSSLSVPAGAINSSSIRFYGCTVNYTASAVTP